MNWMLTRGLALGVIALGLSGQARAEDAKDNALPRKELDARINMALRDIINLGSTIFNAGDEHGCYRLYEGALATTTPLLDHRPELKKSVEEKMARARNLPSVVDRAFALREAMDDIRVAIRKDQPAIRPRALWDLLGGEAKVRAIVSDFVAAAATDPKVNFTRSGRYKPDLPKLEQKLVEFISSKTGGPLKYSGKDMKTAHAGMKITEDEFMALGPPLLAALQKNKVPELEARELMDIVYATKKDIVEASKSLWERLGGEEKVKKVVHDLVVAAATDPKVNFTRGGKYKPDLPKLEKQLVEFISSATGGPLKYTGKEMKPAHAGMKITDEEFDALAGHLFATLKKHELPQAAIDELVAKVAGLRKDIVEK